MNKWQRKKLKNNHKIKIDIKSLKDIFHDEADFWITDNAKHYDSHLAYLSKIQYDQNKDYQERMKYLISLFNIMDTSSKNILAQIDKIEMNRHKHYNERFRYLADTIEQFEKLSNKLACIWIIISVIIFLILFHIK